MFWLKNFRMSGMQLAKTRCWAMYSNWGEKQMNWDRPWGPARPQSPVAGLDPSPPHLVDVIELEVLEQKEQHGRNGFDNDLLVAIDVHPQLHALQHRGPEGHRGTWPGALSPPAGVRGQSCPPPGSQEPPTTSSSLHNSWQTTTQEMVRSTRKPQPKPQIPPAPSCAPSPSHHPQHSTRCSRSLTASPPAGHRPGC